MLRSLLGWGYCLVKADWKALMKDGRLADVVFSSLRYEVAPDEYWYFDFPVKSAAERAEWAGTTAMWKAQRRFVEKDAIGVFAHKERFMQKFGHLMASGGDSFIYARSDFSRAESLVGGDWFLKPADGQCGTGGFHLDAKALQAAEVARMLEGRLAEGNRYILERCLVNHEALRRVNPSCLNTLRIVTGNDGQNAEILFARARFGNGADVDNLSAGGFATVVDHRTGRVVSDAVSTNTGRAVYFPKHPITGVEFRAIEIPHWDKVVELALAASRVEPRARVVGWDIAVCEDGVYLVEGNHNWCKILWQLPARKGMKKELAKYVQRFG